MLEIIIPILNEEKYLTEHAGYYTRLSKDNRIIFVDGGSTDQSVAVAARIGEVIPAPQGRAAQKNAGAQHAKAPWLLFLNVDAHIDPQCTHHLPNAMQTGDIAGCFSIQIEEPRFIFRVYEWALNMRARKAGIIDADLGTLIRRDHFFEQEGFDPLPIMDDIVFSKRLRKFGKVRVLPFSIRVSSRKWHENGFYRTFMNYTLAYLQHWTGIEFFRHRPKAAHE
ncbi:MAG: glycosyltransferase family 2 protein [Candidatus Omnitrophica bacterium]|nr:glycosyltransferase family 2 protein [Candidatus Omnitrophota bacterium]